MADRGTHEAVVAVVDVDRLRSLVSGAKLSPLGFHFHSEIDGDVAKFYIRVVNDQGANETYRLIPKDEPGMVRLANKIQASGLAQPLQFHLSYFTFHGQTTFKLIVDETPKERVFLSGSAISRAGAAH